MVLQIFIIFNSFIKYLEGKWYAIVLTETIQMIILPLLSLILTFFYLYILHKNKFNLKAMFKFYIILSNFNKWVLNVSFFLNLQFKLLVIFFWRYWFYKIIYLPFKCMALLCIHQIINLFTNLSCCQQYINNTTAVGSDNYILSRLRIIQGSLRWNIEQLIDTSLFINILCRKWIPQNTV